MIRILSERVCEFLLLFVVLLLAHCIGIRILKLFRGLKRAAFRDFIFSSFIGLGVFGYFVFLAGVCGLLYSWVMYLLLFIVLILSLREIREIASSFLEWIGLVRARQSGALEACLILVLVVSGVLVLFGTLAPPSLYDSLVYHLAAPDVYISNHSITKIPFNFFASFPAVGEMLFTMGMLLYNDILAKLINFVFLVLAVMAVYDFSNRYFNKKTALLGSVFFCTVPTVMLLATGAYIDLILTSFCFMVIYSFILWLEENRIEWLILTGMFSGFAVGTKYTGAIVFIILVMGILVKSVIVDRKLQAALRNIGFAFIPFMVLFSPWLVKNWVFTGNPVFPFLFKTSDIGWSASNASNYFAHIQGHGMPVNSIWDVFLLPWVLTTRGIKFGGSLDIWGPIILISVPFLVFIKKIKREIWVVLLFIMSYYVIWLFTGRVARFLVPVIPGLSIIAGYVFIEIFKGREIRKVINAVLSVVFVVILAHNFYMYVFCETIVDPFKAAMGRETREEYLFRKIPYYPAVKYINEQLPDGARVLFVGEARGYYCKKDYIASSVFNKTPIVEWSEQSASAGALKDKLKKERITHIFFNESEAKRLKGSNIFYWTERGRKNYQELIEQHSSMIFRFKGLYIYRLN